jgi:hypothetical protein
MEVSARDVIVACATVASADMLTTYLFLSLGRGVELNPLLSALISSLGLLALIVWLPVESLALYATYRCLKGLRQRFGSRLRVELTPFMVGVAVSINNLTLLFV